MKVITTVNPKISNWLELVEQFGIHTPIGTNYKTAYEIYKDVVIGNQHLDFNVSMSEPIPVKPGVMVYAGKSDEYSVIMVECEKDNYDSANCIFNYVGMEGSQRVYEYAGTAK